MTHFDEKENTLYIVEEAPCRCELCGKVEETRPYGPDGKEVCFACGMLTPEIAAAQFDKRLKGQL